MDSYIDLPRMSTIPQTKMEALCATFVILARKEQWDRPGKQQKTRRSRRIISIVSVQGKGQVRGREKWENLYFGDSPIRKICRTLIGQFPFLATGAKQG